MKTVAHNIAFVTTPDLDTARRLAGIVLQEKAAACVNLLPQVESHYWWEGKLERSAEVLMVFKTMQSKLKALENLIVKNHPYDTPEFISFPITAGNMRYLDWITRTCLSKMSGDDLAAKLRSAE